jgi:hypothetical protein
VLGNLSVQWVQDQSFMEESEFENSFIEKRKHRNFYEGYSRLQYPYYSYTRYQYSMKTSATSGSVRSPGFGENFEAKKFKNRVYYDYTIYLPTTLSSVTSQYNDLSLVLDFQVDVQLYGGNEFVSLNSIGKHAFEEFYNTGNVSIIRRYTLKDIKDQIRSDQKYLLIAFVRDIDQINVYKQLEKRVTGFSLDWYFEDGVGKRVDVEQDEKYLSDENNKRFIKFMNIFYQLVSVLNASAEDMWDSVKDYRLEYWHRKLNNDASYCYPIAPMNVNDFLEEQAIVLNMTNISHDLPIYKTQMNDSFLWLGFQLFGYLAHCPDGADLKRYQYYIDVFNHDSHGTMIEAEY